MKFMISPNQNINNYRYELIYMNIPIIGLYIGPTLKLKII